MINRRSIVVPRNLLPSANVNRESTFSKLGTGWLTILKSSLLPPTISSAFSLENILRSINNVMTTNNTEELLKQWRISVLRRTKLQDRLEIVKRLVSIDKDKWQKNFQDHKKKNEFNSAATHIDRANDR